MAAETFAAAAAVEVYKDVKNIIVSFDQVRSNEKNLEKNYEKLKEEAESLFARRADILEIICRDKTKQATEECKWWIDRVNQIEKEMPILKEGYDREQMYRFKQHRISQRSKLSKRMVDKYEELHFLWTKGSRFVKDIVVERSPELVIKTKAPKIEDKPSLYDVVEKALEFLGDEGLTRIGIWGMVGVGKTAIMQNLNNNEQVAKMFDLVIFVTLTEEGDEEKLQPGKMKLKRAKEKLQLEIAQRLKLNLEGITNTNTIASRISEELKCKKYLLLLDDVWGSFDLDEIGICDNENGKVVLASRHRDVCLDMCVDEIIHVKPLSEGDAWKLFREKLGRDITADFRPVAELIIKECANLPLLIDKVARTFRKKNKIRLWWAGLKNLQKWPNVKFQGMDELLDLLRFCYEELDEEEKKLCFLYGALYPEGCEIFTDYLLECWRAEGFVHDVEEFTAHDRALEILDDLINVSLLESGQKLKYIRMNKVLRNMALKISSESKDSKYVVRVCKELPMMPDEDEWKEAKRMSLMDNNLHTLPTRPCCNNLSTLLLQRNDDLTDIPELFFESMQSLRVLDLHRTSITMLPPSLCCLTSLRALYLNSCKELMELPSRIDKLEHLEVLDIRGTGINSLPVQIGCLKRLRCLRLSLSMEAEIERNVISMLSLLEELVVDVHPENAWWIQVVKAIAEEVATLTKLTSLSFCFPEVDSLSSFITKSSAWKNPCFTFQFSIGHYQSTRYKILDYFEHEICRYLKYANGEAIDQMIKEILAESNALELIGYKGPLILSDLGIENINKLRSCFIEGCSEIETIIDGNGMRKAVLECLEKMYISNVPKLRSIWDGPVPAGSLHQLTTLVLFKCLKLKRIFSGGMIQQLSKLQHLEVQECQEIEEIIKDSEHNGLESGTLPSLTTLILHNLPELRIVWADNSIKCPPLKCCKITLCPLLINYPF